MLSKRGVQVSRLCCTSRVRPWSGRGYAVQVPTAVVPSLQRSATPLKSAPTLLKTLREVVSESSVKHSRVRLVLEHLQRVPLATLDFETLTFACFAVTTSHYPKLRAGVHSVHGPLLPQPLVQALVLEWASRVGPSGEIADGNVTLPQVWRVCALAKVNAQIPAQAFHALKTAVVGCKTLGNCDSQEKLVDVGWALAKWERQSRLQGKPDQMYSTTLTTDALQAITDALNRGYMSGAYVSIKRYTKLCGACEMIGFRNLPLLDATASAIRRGHRGSNKTVLNGVDPNVVGKFMRSCSVLSYNPNGLFEFVQSAVLADAVSKDGESVLPADYTIYSLASIAYSCSKLGLVPYADVVDCLALSASKSVSELDQCATVWADLLWSLARMSSCRSGSETVVVTHAASTQPSAAMQALLTELRTNQDVNWSMLAQNHPRASVTMLWACSHMNTPLDQLSIELAKCSMSPQRFTPNDISIMYEAYSHLYSRTSTRIDSLTHQTFQRAGCERSVDAYRMFLKPLHGYVAANAALFTRQAASQIIYGILNLRIFTEADTVFGSFERLHFQDMSSMHPLHVMRVAMAYARAAPLENLDVVDHASKIARMSVSFSKEQFNNVFQARQLAHARRALALWGISLQHKTNTVKIMQWTPELLALLHQAIAAHPGYGREHFRAVVEHMSARLPSIASSVNDAASAEARAEERTWLWLKFSLAQVQQRIEMEEGAQA